MREQQPGLLRRRRDGDRPDDRGLRWEKRVVPRRRAVERAAVIGACIDELEELNEQVSRGPCIAEQAPRR